MNRKQLDTSISAFLSTQSDTNKEEYWSTPRDMAEYVLQDFANFVAAAQIEKRNNTLKVKRDTLKGNKVN